MKKCSTVDFNIFKATGNIASEIAFSHSMKEENFYNFLLKVPRKSGIIDKIPVIISEKLLENNYFRYNDVVSIAGSIRTYIKDHNKQVFLFASTINLVTDDNPLFNNYVEIVGHITESPIYRTTPEGRIITDLCIVVNRGSRGYFIPAICWEETSKLAKTLSVGSQVRAIGRFQSRVYFKTIKAIETKHTAYELSISKLLEE